MTEEITNLKFLAKRSKQAIESQVGSYRQQHTYAGTIIGITFIFIPFFLSGLSDSGIIIQLISVIPVALFFGGLLSLLSIFRGKPLDMAFAMEKYDELLKNSFEETLLFIIESNRRAYNGNKTLAEKARKKYDRGIKLTIIAMMISIALLLANSFVQIKKVPIKIQLNNHTLNLDTSNADSKQGE